jgi:signal transduction histidine kinase
MKDKTLAEIRTQIQAEKSPRNTRDELEQWVMKRTAELLNANEQLKKEIKDRKRAEEALRKSQEQLHQAQKMKALGTLVAGVAHEINNPVNLIMFNIPLLQRVWNDFQAVLKEYAAKEPDRKYGGLPYNFLEENLDQLLSDMDMAVNRIAKIVSDLKNFSKQSNVADKQPMQINLAIENALRLMQTTLNKKGVVLELDLAKGLPFIEGNLQYIEQIILNIMLNAIEALDKPNGRIKIETGLQKNDGQVYIAISDNGSGIDPSISDRLFDPFVTDKQSEGGTGLGLSITYSLVKSHNGEITFTSRINEGTTFRVFFPIAARAKLIKVLVVDDDEMIRDMLSEALTLERRYLVELASNGVEAFIKLGTYRPDILILDIFMPEMDGLEVCRSIKSEPKLSDMKVIITTGDPGHPKLKEICALGYTNICYKPLDLIHFQNVIDNILIE